MRTAPDSARLSLAILGLALLWACDRGAKPDPAPVPAQETKGSLRVNGQALSSASVLESVLQRVSPASLGSSPEELRKLSLDELKTRLEKRIGALAVNEAVEHGIYALLADQKIKKSGVLVTDEALEERWKEELGLYQKSPSASLMSFEDYWKAQGLSVELRRREMKREIGLDLILGEPDELELKRHFENLRDHFSGRQVELFHILLASEDEAKEVLEPLRAGQSFADLATKSSKEAATARQGGRVGWIKRRNDVPEELAALAFGLKAGELAGPVKTVYGWHIATIRGERKGAIVEFESFRSQVILEVRKKRRVALMVAERRAAVIGG